MIKRTRRRDCARGILLGLTTLSMCLALGGDLEPPGPPAPTMKTMAEVEPRTPIHASDLPLIITSSGSYYLVEDISTAGGGIQILAGVKDVTIDLMGFTLSGGTGNGILAGNPSGGNIVVKNGTVSGWAADGVTLAAAANSMVINLAANGNGGYGIQIGDQGRVFNSVATENTLAGFHIGDNTLISGCIAGLNVLHGIVAFSGSRVVGNVSTDNGTGGNPIASGIAVLNINATEVHIEGNTVTGNALGIWVATAGNLIIANSASGNTNDYSIVAGNDLGPIGDAATSTSPWANIQF